MAKEGVENDQYYTKESVAQLCIDALPFDLNSFSQIIEPSAGRGDFYRLLPQDISVGVDLDPKTDDLVKSDFFDIDVRVKGPVLTIGNPPFGKNSKLAYEFFQQSARYSDCIAFIVPKTFRKPSMINRLDRRFHLVHEVVLPEDSFYVEVDGKIENYSVPCVFQVWLKKTKQLHDSHDWLRGVVRRDLIVQLTKHEDFEFVKIKQNPTEQEKQQQCATADFCVRRVGGAAGKVYKDYDEIYRDFKSHYYIKENVSGVEKIMSSIEWDVPENPKYDTAGNPSISKHELISFYIEQKEKDAREQ